ncbi:putative BCL-2-associated athanoprotein 7 [Hibiscus syriacus]|uniref:BCL-2-associated athanoprotein 7 n=1 Tax=Hibiscus syriacus TaxID=106335 RepID=A0A6A2Y4S5_HIBSY|nr:putative BCL-2-associated athanoprotein 7 [Hibiscus syriacus]
MTKRYTILQKKLKELESQLNQVLSLPLNTQCHQSLSQDIQLRFLFLNNLLSAEVVSRPRNPFHLQHIAERLLELEAAFKEWDGFQSSAPDHVEQGSPCSCTESCLNDEGEAAEAAEEGSSELISLSHLEQAVEASTELRLVAGLDFEGFKEQDEMEHVVKKEMSDEEDSVEARKTSMVKGEERSGVWFGKSLAIGVLIGMILMAVLMVRFYGCCLCYEGADYTDSLTPT